MSETGRDPWAGEAMSRSDAQRRYNNLIQYQLRPMLNDRRLSDDERVQVLKRIVASVHRFRFESGAVPGGGTREEITDLLSHFLKPESEASVELKDWVKRTIRGYGGTLENADE